MNTLILITLVIGYVSSLVFTIITIFHILRYIKENKSKLIAYLSIITIINAGIIYSSLYFFSTVVFFSDFFNILLWKLSLISLISTLNTMSLVFTFLKEYKKTPIFPFLYFTTITGLLIGALLSSESIQLIEDISTINYSFNFSMGLITTIFLFSILIYILFNSILIHANAQNKNISNSLLVNTLFFIMPISTYVFYIITHLPIFRELHLLLFWTSVISASIMLIKKPEMLLGLTNKISSVDIYHKSGVLLYSYKFETHQIEIGNKKNDSTIWGNILIGINHILAEFIGEEDKIDVIQTKNGDIVVNYNNDNGIAVLVITDRKNDILEKIMNDFVNEFILRYKEELNEIQDLNKIINVSEFRETNEIIEKIFQMYLR